MDIELQEYEKIEDGKSSWIFRCLFIYLGVILPLISIYQPKGAESAFSLRAHYSLPVTMFFAAAFTTVYLYIFLSHNKRKWMIAVSGLALYGIYLFLMWDKIIMGVNWWILHINPESIYSGNGGIAASAGQASNDYLICAVLVVYAFLIVGLSINRLFRFQLFTLAIWWVVLGGTAFDLFFHWRIIFFIFYIFCLLGMGSKGIARRHGKTYRKRIKSMRKTAVWHNGIALAMLCIMLMGCYYIANPPEKYIETKAFIKRQNRFIELVENSSMEEIWDFLKGEIYPSDIAVGGMSGGQLGKVSGIEYRDKPQISITVPLVVRSQGLYLKGFIGGEYTGNEWLREDDKEEFENEEVTYNILSGMLDIPTRAISIKVLDADNTYSYRPYYSVLSSRQQRIKEDEEYFYQDSESLKEVFSAVYSFCKYDQAGSFAQKKYSYGTSSDSFVHSVNREKKYKQEAWEKYVDFPESEERLAAELSRQNIEDSNGEMLIRDGKVIGGYYRAYGLSSYVKFVQQFLWNHAQYDLMPGKLDEGADFVDDFLYEKKKGYCTAYASAGTLIFRYLGIPARYVEGYIVGKSDMSVAAQGYDYINSSYVRGGEATYGIVVELTDRNAHAWVEIYEEGVGWIPIEVTPGYDGEVDSVGEVQYSDDVNTQVTTEDSTETTQTTTKKEETKKNGETTVQTMEQETSKAAEEEATEKTKSREILLFVLLGVVAAYLLGSGIVIYHKKHKNFYKRKKKKKRVKYVQNDYVILNNPQDVYQRECLKWEKAWHRVLRFQGYRDRYPQTLWNLAGNVVKIYTYLDVNEVYRHLKLIEKCHYSKEGIKREEYTQIYEFLYGMVYASYTHARWWEKPFLKIMANRYFHLKGIRV